MVIFILTFFHLDNFSTVMFHPLDDREKQKLSPTGETKVFSFLKPSVLFNV